MHNMKQSVQRSCLILYHCSYCTYNIIKPSQPFSCCLRLPLSSVDIEPNIGNPLKIWPIGTKYPTYFFNDPNYPYTIWMMKDY